MEVVEVKWIYLSNCSCKLFVCAQIIDGAHWLVTSASLFSFIHQYIDLSIPKYERFAPNYFAWNPKKGLILFSMNNVWYIFMKNCRARTLIGDYWTLRHSSLEFKVNFCQDKIFAKEISWKVKQSKISTNSPYISILRLLKLFDNWQKLEDNQRTATAKDQFLNIKSHLSSILSRLTLQINHCSHMQS